MTSSKLGRDGVVWFQRLGIIYRLKVKQGTCPLDEWEQKFLEDQLRKVEDFGQDAFAPSEKQAPIIERIATKLGVIPRC